jgi:hypothetical protein
MPIEANTLITLLPLLADEKFSTNFQARGARKEKRDENDRPHDGTLNIPEKFYGPRESIKAAESTEAIGFSLENRHGNDFFSIEKFICFR